MKNIASLAVSALILPVLMYSYSRTCFMLALLMLLLFWLAPLLRVAPIESLHRADVGYCRLSIRQRYALGQQSGIGRPLEPGVDRASLVLLADVSVGGLPNPLFGMNIEPYKPVDFFFIAMFYSAGGIASVVMLFCYFHLLGNMRKLSRFMRWVVVVFLLTTLTETYFWSRYLTCRYCCFAVEKK